MAGNLVAPDKPEQPAKPKRPIPTAWFDGDEYSGLPRDPGQEDRKLWLGEMVQEKIGNDGIAILRSRFLQPLKNIGRNKFDLPTQLFESAQGLGRDDLFSVHQQRGRAAPMRPQAFGDSQQECGVASAKFNQSLWWTMRKAGAQCAGHDLRIAHPGVQALQVPAGLNGSRVGGGQLIEEFRFDSAIHGS